MPGTMSKADLVFDLKQILMDAKNDFISDGNREFELFLDQAALALGRYRKRTLLGELTLVADQFNYAAPADIVKPKFGLWGRNEQRGRDPWATNHPGRLPSLHLVDNELHLVPAPTTEQITDLGTAYKFYYFAGHHIDKVATSTTIKAADRDLLLLRATVFALQSLANKNINKPVRLGAGGVGSMPKNGTPQGLAKELLEQFERMAA